MFASWLYALGVQWTDIPMNTPTPINEYARPEEIRNMVPLPNNPALTGRGGMFGRPLELDRIDTGRGFISSDRPEIGIGCSWVTP